MILRSPPLWQSETWQQQLAGAIRDPAELMALLALDPAAAPDCAQALRDFPLRVPRAFAARMRPGDWADPLLLQVLPSHRESEHQVGFVADPLGENDSNPVPGLIHKYRGRVLLITSPACAVHCRYCFRRHFPYDDNTPGSRDWDQALDYIAADPGISEVILSGGDPLAAGDGHLQRLVARIAAIGHVRRLRLHTRLPVVLPARITEDCLAWLTGSRLQVVMVIHANHANELDSEVAAALAALAKQGVTLLNQAVLLRGVNDSADALADLSERLFELGVLPYYLHLLDRVSGAGHFEVGEKEGRRLYRELLARLPGFLVPRLVREQAGERSKTPLAPA